MQELAENIRAAAAPGTINVAELLRDASKKWAEYCIEDLDDELIDKGLAISASIARFLNEYERGPDCD